MDDVGAIAGSALERARSISGILREEALAGERQGRLTDRTAEAILSQNLCEIMVPREAGGMGASRVAFFEATEEIARADGSAGWCVGLCNGINAFIWRGASERLREEVFGAGPVSCWASLLPRGRSVAEEGGFRLTGAFGWGSGSSMSRWVVVTAPLADRGGHQWFRAHVVPKADAKIKEGSWDVMGLRATHSVDYDIEAFVPAHRTFEYPMASQANPGGVFGREGTVLGQIGMVAFASGVALGSLADLLELAPKTKRLLVEGLQSEDNVVQFGIGELDGRLRAARSHYLALLAELDAAVAAGRPPEVGLELMQAGQTLTRAARDTAVFAFDQGGTTVIYAASPLQRRLRDLFTGLKHGQLTPAVLGRIGKVRLGLEFGEVRL
jgi:alkylation response protein AidB-like acyl-CoA dehydrogenase